MARAARRTRGVSPWRGLLAALLGASAMGVGALWLNGRAPASLPAPQAAEESAPPAAVAPPGQVASAPPAPAPRSTPGRAPSAAVTLARARSLTRRLYENDLEVVWSAFTPQVRAQWGSLREFRAFRAAGQRTYGPETRVQREELTRSGAVTYYTRTATFARGAPRDWTLIFGLDDAGRVQEFGIVAAGVLPAGLQPVPGTRP